MGPNFDEEILGATRALYAPLIRKPSAGVKVTADVAYGSDPRQKLDVYQPAGAAEHVLVYIPGGGFVGGDKNLDGVFYVNLGNYFASHGILTIVANYRLAPAHAWPAGAQDVAGAVAWARANAKSFGGDPARIMLFGQSAGSTHAATYLFDPTFQPVGPGRCCRRHPDERAIFIPGRAAPEPEGLFRRRSEPLCGTLAAHPRRQEPHAAPALGCRV